MSLSLLFLIFGFMTFCEALRLSFTQNQDLKVWNINGVLRCDQLICPAEGIRCVAVKKSLDEDLSKIERKNICYNSAGEVADEISWSEENIFKQRMNSRVDVTSNGKSVVSNINLGLLNNLGDGITEGIGAITAGIGSTLSGVGNFIGSIFN